MEPEKEIIEIIWDLADTIPEQMGPECAECTDFSEASIGHLDDELDDWLDNEFPPEEKRQIYVWGLGAYVSAIIDLNFVGTWARDESSGEIWFEPATSGVGIYPFNWMSKKLELGEDLEPKYQMACNLMAADRRSE